MAAFVVLAPRTRTEVPRTGRRLSIFPGSATPTVFSAGMPFWIGYGFVREPGDSVRDLPELDPETRFELGVDGEPVPMAEDVKIERGRVVSKQCVACFASGLPAGWHRLAGRWYDAGSLVLTSDRWIEFVER